MKLGDFFCLSERMGSFIVWLGRGHYKNILLIEHVECMADGPWVFWRLWTTLSLPLWLYENVWENPVPPKLPGLKGFFSDSS